jgi:hypothetical protein
MKFRIWALVASITVSVALMVPAAGVAAPRKHPVKIPPDYAAWTRVAVCEEGGWTAAHSWVPRYSTDYGGYTIIGINGHNWISYSLRLHLNPTLPRPGATTMAQRVQAIRIGDAIQHGHVPDQYGCASW